MKSRKRIIRIIVVIVLAVLIAGAAFLLWQYAKIKPDLDRLEQESYDTVFLSMYPTDNYVEGDYMHFRGMQTVRCDYVISNGKVMRWFMEKINETDNVVTTVYLGIDPEKTTKEDIVLMIQENPQIRFEVALAHPQITYWLNMSPEKCEEVLQEYQVFAQWMVGLPNAGTYLFSGEEWLVCNKSNYEDVTLTNTAVSQFLMCNSDYQHPYILKAETIEAEIAGMRELISSYREAPVAYPDGSGLDIVFFGDSIIGNYTDSTSVPEVVSSLTGANVYNCGYGGRSAALGERDPYPVSMIVQALIDGDVSALPQEAQVSAGITKFLNREKKDNELMFVFNFGLNDYFNGYPVAGEDPYDIATYSGALRTAVKSLKEAYPEAVIMLNTPNYTVYFEYGQGIQSENGGTLKEYADAVLQLAEELDVEVLDNFNELPINAENWKDYLSDGCHPNEYTRFLLGTRIALKIQ